MPGPLDNLLSMFSSSDLTRKSSEDPYAPSAPSATPTPPTAIDKLKDLLNTPAHEVAGKIEALTQSVGEGAKNLAETPLKNIPGKFPVPDYPNVLGHLPSLPSALPADAPIASTDVPGMPAPQVPAPAPSAPAPQPTPAPSVPHTPYPLGQSMGEGAQAPSIQALISALMPGHTPPSDGGGLDPSGMGAPPSSGRPGAPVAPSSGFEAFLKSLSDSSEDVPSGPGAKAATVTEAKPGEKPNAEPAVTTPADAVPTPTKVSAGGDSAPAVEKGEPKSLGRTLSQGSKGNGSRAGSAVGGVFSEGRKDEENNQLAAGLMQFALSALLKPSWSGGSGIWNAINDASDTYNNYGAQRKAERDEVDTRAKNKADLTKSAAETAHLYASAENQRAGAGKARKETETLTDTKGKENWVDQATPGMSAGAKLTFEKLTKGLTADDQVAGSKGYQQYAEAKRQAKIVDDAEKAEGATAAQKDTEKARDKLAADGNLDFATLSSSFPKTLAHAKTDPKVAAHLRVYMKNKPTELAKLEAALK